MLFSEPKIPQSGEAPVLRSLPHRFSALQRAENSSMGCGRCGSRHHACFSALQRAENSSIYGAGIRRRREKMFQCSSASRKFLNLGAAPLPARGSRRRFSALQRAENSSIPGCSRRLTARSGFSALQRAENSSIPRPRVRKQRVAVFQCSSASRKFLNPSAIRNRDREGTPFQCSSASRKFLNADRRSPTPHASRFQCSSASRKFLNFTH